MPQRPHSAHFPLPAGNAQRATAVAQDGHGSVEIELCVDLVGTLILACEGIYLPPMDTNAVSHDGSQLG